MKEYRPPGWENMRNKAIAGAGKLPNQTEFPIVMPSSLEWEILKGQLFEAGASAMLKALKPLILEIAPASRLVDILYKEK